MSARSLLVTGTDTGIGKTHASVALLHALRAQGHRAIGMKPIASGCERIDGRWRNEDALALQAASDPRPAYDDVNPVALPEPTAPTLAAQAAGVTVEIAALHAAHARLAAAADIVLVEGAGGWDAPLAEGLEHSDLARHLGGAVVLLAADALSRTTPGNEIFRYVSDHTMQRLHLAPGDPADCAPGEECPPIAAAVR